MSSLINLASGLAPAAEISASNDGQHASGKHDGERFANWIWVSWFLIQYPQAHSYRWN